MLTKILITNDDGIYSSGLKALAEAMREIGEVYIVAPDRDQSAVSHSISLYRPLRMEEIGENTYSVDGTPTDCVNLAVNGILKDKRPDLVVSGINKGENLGDDITYSGTVSGAMEGTLLGIPSIAISLAAKKDFHFDTAAHYALLVARYVLKHSLPQGTLINLNIPNLIKEKIKGIKVTRQGRRVFGDPIAENIDPRGRKYYWIGGNELGSLEVENSDMIAVYGGYVSVTPIKLDFTDYNLLEKLKTDFSNLSLG